MLRRARSDCCCCCGAGVIIAGAGVFDGGTRRGSRRNDRWQRMASPKIAAESLLLGLINATAVTGHAERRRRAWTSSRIDVAIAADVLSRDSRVALIRVVNVYGSAQKISRGE